MAGKPTKYGFKVWCLAAPDDGYAYKILPFTGGTDPTIPHDLDKLVMHMLRDYLGAGRTLFADNYFVSKAVARVLLERDTYLVGTCRVERTGLPKASAALGPKRGDSCFHQDGDVYLTYWRDKKEVIVVSTGCEVNGEENARRWVETAPSPEVPSHWAKQPIPCPSVVRFYQKNYRWVDKSDQLRASYPYHRRAKKWYIYFFHYLVELAVINTFLLYCRVVPPPKMRFLDFKTELSRILIRNSNVKARVPQISLRLNDLHHLYTTTEEAYTGTSPPHGRCNMCRCCTTTRCRQCDVYLCHGCTTEYQRFMYQDRRPTSMRVYGIHT